MEIRYLSINRLAGIIGLPDGADFELLSSDDGARAFITLEKEQYFMHLKRRSAIGAIMLEALLGQGTESGATPQERFNAALEREKIGNTQNDNALLIVEVLDHVEQVSGKNLMDFGGIGGGFQLFSPGSLIVAARKMREIAFGGLSLTLPENLTDSIREVGCVAFAIEEDSGRFLYSIDSKASISVTTQSPLDEKAVARAAKMSNRLRDSAGLENVVHLLSLSSLQNHDRLVSFLTAWTGLEMFIKKTFKDTYEPEIIDLFQSSAPPSASAFVTRMQVVMNDKYNIRDKFVAVASVLNKTGAESDIEIFKRLKKRRDDLAHAMRGDLATLPAEETRALLRKYLRLHLER